MLAPYCPVHRSRVLLSFSDLEGIRNLPEGIEIRFRCSCGHRGTWLTGRVRKGRPTTGS